MKKIYLLSAVFVFQSAASQMREFNFYLERDNSLNILNLSSVRTVPCAGYGIRTFQIWNHDTVIIDIRGFVRPEPCYSGTDVAKGNITLTGIRTRTFVVKFRWKAWEDLWKIALHGTSFRVTSIRSVFTSYAK